MVSSCHMGTKDKNIKKARKRPRKNQINRDNVRIIWGNEHTVHVKIPLLIDDYNHWMLGVDLADQLISYYRSKLRCRRTWMPIFLHCLDVLRINSYILYREMSKKRGIPIPKKCCHKKFVLGLIDALITRGELAEDKDSPRKSKRSPAAAPIKDPVSCVKVPREKRTLIRFDKKNPSLKFDHLRFQEGEHNRVQAN